jgi:glutamate/tyrosine decarboxylase-like PLP-dependent enzyme
MVFEFKSRATGTIVMTGDVASSILKIIGKEASPQGVIVPDTMEACISALLAAIDRQKANDKSSDNAKEDADGKPVISLAQRAHPFIDMLRAAKAANRDITWGV